MKTVADRDRPYTDRRCCCFALYARAVIAHDVAVLGHPCQCSPILKMRRCCFGRPDVCCTHASAAGDEAAELVMSGECLDCHAGRMRAATGKP